MTQYDTRLGLDDFIPRPFHLERVNESAKQLLNKRYYITGRRCALPEDFSFEIWLIILW
jgi:hypothetical protein